MTPGPFQFGALGLFLAFAIVLGFKVFSWMSNLWFTVFIVQQCYGGFLVLGLKCLPDPREEHATATSFCFPSCVSVVQGLGSPV